MKKLFMIILIIAMVVMMYFGVGFLLLGLGGPALPGVFAVGFVLTGALGTTFLGLSAVAGVLLAASFLVFDMAFRDSKVVKAIGDTVVKAAKKVAHGIRDKASRPLRNKLMSASFALVGIGLVIVTIASSQSSRAEGSGSSINGNSVRRQGKKHPDDDGSHVFKPASPGERDAAASRVMNGTGSDVDYQTYIHGGTYRYQPN